jgi:hypothetical protein
MEVLHAFYHTATALWNRLPIELRAYAYNTNSLALSAPQFLAKLKTSVSSFLSALSLSSSYETD